MHDADSGPAHGDRMTTFLWRHRWLICVMAAIGAVGGYVGSRWMERIYRSDVVTAPVAADNTSMRSLMGQVGSLAALAGINIGGADATGMSITIATLKSRVFLGRFIETHGLMPILFAKQWDGTTKQWRTAAGGSPPTVQDGVGYMLKHVLRVLEDRDKGLVTIRVEWGDPKLAADWANALVADLNALMRERAIQNADTTLQYLRRELESAQSVEVRQSIAMNVQAQVNKRAMANTRPEFSLTVVDPGVVSDPRGFVQPIPALMAAIGLFAGALIAILVALLIPRRTAGGRAS